MFVGDRYQVVKPIGSGTSGKAFLARDLKNQSQYCVLKEVSINGLSNHRERIQARKEVQILSKLKHPNIVKYIDSFEKSGYLYIVTEYAEDGDLYSCVKAHRNTSIISEQVIMKYFIQICMAIKYLHERKILHRDLKSRNIFLTHDKKIIKIGDFGIAKNLSNTTDFAQTAIGTPYYLSPEICESKPYNYKSDIWSLGCILYEMLTLKHAFDSKNMKELLLKIIGGTYDAIPNNYSVELRTILDMLLKKDPDDRPTIDHILGLSFVQNYYTMLFPKKPRLYGEDVIEDNVFQYTTKLKDHKYTQDTDLHDKFNHLIKNFGEEQAFSLLVNWVFGSIPLSKVLDRYKWGENDTYGDIIDHIHWVKLYERNKSKSMKSLSKKDTKNKDSNIYDANIKEFLRTMEDGIINTNIGDKDIEDGKQISHRYFIKIDNNGYMFEGNIYRYGIFSGVYNTEDNIYETMEHRLPQKSVYQKVEMVKEILRTDIGKELFFIIYNILKSFKATDWRKETVNVIGERLDFILNKKGFYNLIWQVIFNERRFYERFSI